MLVGIALADGSFHERERAAIYLLADLLGFAEVAQLISMANAQLSFSKEDTTGPVEYTVTPKQVVRCRSWTLRMLSIDNAASDADIKRRYRKLSDII